MSFPGPEELGRGLVVLPGAAVSAPFADAPRVTIDEAVLASPEVAAATAAVLHEAWDERRRVVIELGVPLETLRAPEAERRPPYELDPGFTFERERLQFLVWANSYDGRKDGEPIWWHGVRASRIGASLDGPADVLLPDGTPAWCDGGPRRPVDGVDTVVVHRDSIDAGLLTPARLRPPQAELASDQLAAVAHPGGPARIIAPAGSGKTRVLTERIRHLLVDRGHEPQLVTAVAYNVMAAEQLRERTAGFRPTIRTLNSLGLNVCSRRGDWRIAEEPFCREVLSGLVKTARKVGTDPLAPYLDALATIRLGLVPPEKAEDLHPDAAGIAAAFPAYRDALHASGRLDFDEQIYKAVELLLADPDLRAEVRAEARTLLVDEFQDLTPAHLLLIRLVAGPAADVFGVGDDDQVIYGYAGADPGFLIDYRSYFPGAATYDLQVNYRCPPAVVDAARTLLGHNIRRIDKTIHAAPARPAEAIADGAPSADGSGVAALEAARARLVAPPADALVVRSVPNDDMGPATVEMVRQWIDAGVALSDIAVLTRVNSSLLPVQLLLDEANIPYRAAVGPWILERAGTAAALAYLRIAADPTRITRADLRATVRRPSRKISPKAIDMLARDAVTSLRSIRSLAEWLADKEVFAKDSDRVDAYASDLEALAQAMSKPGNTTADLLRLVRDTIGLGEAMETLDASKGALDRSSNGDDLAALLQVAHLHPEGATFETWLHQKLAGARAFNGESGNGAAEPTVHLATVHRVKGREWSRVVVFGADAGLFPHRLSIDTEEERRIFHVAITRAKDQAVVLADAAGPSPFVEELHRAAPPRPAVDPDDPNPFRRLTMPAAPAPKRSTPRAKAKAVASDEPSFAAAPGAEIILAGGLHATIKEVRRGEVLVETNTGSTVVSFGSAIRANGENVRLVAPADRVDAGIAALKAWRTALAKEEGKPPYVYLSDAHITGIAERDPDTLDRLARCKGIGPGKLDSYGETLLALLDDL